MAVTFTPRSDASPTAGRLPQSGAEAVFHLLVGFLLVVLSVSSFAVSTVFGVAVTFLLTLAVATVLPASVPVVIVSSFLYQNMVVAWFTPYVPDNNTFDALRGANFVILMTAYCAFLAASLQVRLRAIPRLRPWLLIGIGLAAIIGFYLLLGAARGNVKDAIVYFRNTISPLACFHIALVAASLYRIDLRKSLLWLGAAIIVYGYCELIFTLDFLGLFNGDLYIERDIHRQIETGAWEQTLRETGFVLRGLQDIMTTTFFNTPLTAGIFPNVFRIGGPNFHPISYAYALSVISIWLLFRGRWLLPLAALPLIVVIGSKGAMFMLIVALWARVAQGFLGTRLTLLSVPAAAILWVGAAIAYGATHGDYHVLGFLAGLHEFLRNPLGQGLGIGGNLSSTSLHVNWEHAQATGATTVPVESAVGVMLYQMGVGSFAFFGFLTMLIVGARRLILVTGRSDFWFAYITVTTVFANAVLQEEAFYSPLSLGFCLLLTGTALGTFLRESAPRHLGESRRISPSDPRPMSFRTR
ncbi:MAG: hypothetical protein BGN87_06945 [Rhizobiales bacterium 65-79]|jgi:hypothetical protein|nr:hypothetical protein [Hyphomicrobiales bacterium]OJU01019.1 MAG: hypothetical protein BGN87_06945 [Rhizobiales bacterium 65-79]